MADQLTLEELAERTGEPEERLREWQSRGLIGAKGDGLTYLDLERVRLVQLCLRRGISLEAIAEADQAQGIIDRYVEMMSPDRAGRTYSFADAAEIAGLDLNVARTMWANSGLAAEQGETLREEDLEAFRSFKAYLDAGFPVNALAEGTRVFADSLARIAEMESKLFHFYVHERLRAEGLAGDDLVKATESAGEIARPLLEPTILYFHRKAWEKSVREDLVMHMAEEAGLTPPSEVPGELTRAIMFVDLSSFTPMTEAIGDLQAAQVLDRFSSIVREAAIAWDGRVVKQIGDAFMLIFSDARSAAACALEIETRTAKEAQFPAVRAGIHWGTVLYRDGDYVGSNVNIAARLATEADRHQILVTPEVRKEARDVLEIEFVRVGKRKLKGILDSLELFELRSSATTTTDRIIDPVCAVELSPAEISARLALEGTEHAFCSDACLRKFVVAPEKYAGAASERAVG